jgi:hypothetical protein
MLTESLRTDQISEHHEFMDKIKITQKPYSLAYKGLIHAKNPNQQVSCKCTSQVHFWLTIYNE